MTVTSKLFRIHFKFETFKDREEFLIKINYITEKFTHFSDTKKEQPNLEIFQMK